MKSGDKLRNRIMKIAPSFRQFVIHRIDEIDQFRFFLITSIKNEKSSIECRFAKETKDLTEEEIREYFDWNSDDYFMVKDVFTNLSMASFIVLLYSYIEDGLFTICNAEYSDKARHNKKIGAPPFELRYVDMKGDGIQKAKLYLEKVIGLNLHTNKKPWSEVDTLRKIRNSIVHEDRRVSEKIEKDNNIRLHVKAGRLEITDHGPEVYGQIMVKAEYLDYIIPVVKKFFEEISCDTTTYQCA